VILVDCTIYSNYGRSQIATFLDNDWAAHHLTDDLQHNIMFVGETLCLGRARNKVLYQGQV